MTTNDVVAPLDWYRWYLCIMGVVLLVSSTVAAWYEEWSAIGLWGFPIFSFFPGLYIYVLCRLIVEARPWKKIVLDTTP